MSADISVCNYENVTKRMTGRYVKYQTYAILALTIASIGSLPAAISAAGRRDCQLPVKNRAILLDGALVYSSINMNVDADGAPASYRIDGLGLSYTCDGVVALEGGHVVSPGTPNWQSTCKRAWAEARRSGDYSKVKIFGFAADAHGVPLVQKEGDPLPGEAFISTTSVQIRDAPPHTQRRYIDSTAIPYIVLPQPVRIRYHVQDSAVAAVWRPKTGKLAYAVFADTGGHLDEGSVRLHQDLASNPLMGKAVPRAKRQIQDDVIVVVFPSFRAKPQLDSMRWRAEINRIGSAALAKWGGLERLTRCE